MNYNPEYIANIILHVILISSLITIFFFTYAAKVEEEIVKQQVNFIIEDLTDNVNMLPENVRQIVRDASEQLTLPDMTELDNKVIDANQKLMKKVIIMVGITLIVGIYIVYMMSVKYNFSFSHIMKHNLIVLVFVFLTEYCFITYLGKNFRIGDPNFVKKSILTILKKYSETN
jgi:hypothetical protein